jgi:hypothetical protein
VRAARQDVELVRALHHGRGARAADDRICGAFRAEGEGKNWVELGWMRT